LKLEFVTSVVLTFTTCSIYASESLWQMTPG
jgi:hypothetical protein